MNKKIPDRYGAYKKSKALYKAMTQSNMQKNPEHNLTTVEVDPVTGEYYVTVPEWIISEFGWYEGTELNMEVDGDAILISEVD
tara:strand:- start:7418 stop:7666 length:249 start_codon:yes stop_codon:yes gene_type:complete